MTGSWAGSPSSLLSGSAASLTGLFGRGAHRPRRCPCQARATRRYPARSIPGQTSIAKHLVCGACSIVPSAFCPPSFLKGHLSSVCRPDLPAIPRNHCPPSREITARDRAKHAQNAVGETADLITLQRDHGVWEDGHGTRAHRKVVNNSARLRARSTLNRKPAARRSEWWV